MCHVTNLRSHQVLWSVALTLNAVRAFGAGRFATADSRFQRNIASADVTDLLGADRPPSSATPGPNDPSSGSPVTIPLMGNGKTSRPQSERFNAAFAIGADTRGDTASAATCAIKTVESLTPIDGFVVVDSVGFIRMMDALGGVPICIPDAMGARQADLTVNASYQTLDVTAALAYARSRTGTGVGDGSDTNRVGRQQPLLAATAREVFSTNLLTDVRQLLRFLDAAAGAVTAKPGLAPIANVAGLAFSLTDNPSGNATFMTVPFASDAPDSNQVVWTPDAATIWARSASDQPVAPTTGQPGSPGAGTTPATSSGAAGDAPSILETTVAGTQAFTPDDITAVCG